MQVNSNKVTLNPMVAIAFTLFIIFGTMGFTTAVSGCNGGGPSVVAPVTAPELTPIQSDVSDSADKVGKISDSVSQSADNIDKEADQIRSIAPEETRATFEPNLTGINKETQSLRQNSEELAVVRTDLEAAKAQLEVQQDRVNQLLSANSVSQEEISRLEEENQKLQSESQELLRAKMAWIGVFSVFGIGIAMVLGFLTRSSTAILIAIGFVITLGVSVAVSMYMSYIGYATIAITGLAALCVVGYTAYNLFTQNRSVEELVQTSEVAKNYLTQEARDHIFGRGPEPGVADHVQSLRTKELVRTVRDPRKKRRRFDLAESQNHPKYPKIPEGQTYVLDEIEDPSSF